jgi:hypothetical protein
VETLEEEARRKKEFDKFVKRYLKVEGVEEVLKKE